MDKKGFIITVERELENIKENWEELDKITDPKVLNKRVSELHSIRNQNFSNLGLKY